MKTGSARNCGERVRAGAANGHHAPSSAWRRVSCRRRVFNPPPQVELDGLAVSADRGLRLALDVPTALALNACFTLACIDIVTRVQVLPWWLRGGDAVEPLLTVRNMTRARDENKWNTLALQRVIQEELIENKH